METGAGHLYISQYTRSSQVIRKIRRTSEEQSNDQERHESSFVVVNEISISQVALGFSSGLVLLSSLPLSGLEMWAEVVDKILGDQSRLCEDDWSETWNLDGDDRRLSERVDLLKLWIGKTGLLSLIGL
jgi:hypothetical protein